MYQKEKEGIVDHAIEFIETPTFTRQIKEIATDDELKDLQKNLLSRQRRVILLRKPVGSGKSAWRRGHRVKVEARELSTF